MVGVGLILLLTVVFVTIHTFTTMTYFCTGCAAERRDEHAIPFGLCTIGKLRGKVTRTRFTAMIAAVDSKPCAHRWVFSVGSGGSFA